VRVGPSERHAGRSGRRWERLAAAIGIGGTSE